MRLKAILYSSACVRIEWRKNVENSSNVTP